MEAISSPFFSGGNLGLILSPPIPMSSSRQLAISFSTTSIYSVLTEEIVEKTTPRPDAADHHSPSPSNLLRLRLRPPPPLPILLKSTASASSSLLDSLFNAFHHFFFLNPPMSPSVDPQYVLAGNFAPVDELPPTECELIHGSLPSSLNGAYIRNGPNPQYLPRGPHHLFDGDGMLHSLRIFDGRAALCSRYVKTYKYTLERDAGHPVFSNVFSGSNGLIASATRGAIVAARLLTSLIFNPRTGIGLANTSLAFFGHRLYALGESDLPYPIRLTPNHDIQTLPRHDFHGKLSTSMTAHPKIDSDTGETFAFRYGPFPPFLTFFRFDKNGAKQSDVPIFSMNRPSFLHDFAITKKYAVFTENQLGFNLMQMIIGRSPIISDPSRISRVGVIPRYANDESEMKWFNVPGLNLIHAINAWDEDDDAVVNLVGPNILSVQHSLERMDLIHALMEKVRIDLKTGIVTRRPLSARNLDFGVIHPSYVGKKNRFVYAAIGDPLPKISGVVKLDVSQEERRDCIVACRIFGPACYGGEPFFVPRERGNSDSATEEDDGYVISYVHDENFGESRFIVMDAKSPELEIIAAVKLPRRVPYGFHGLFVKESDIYKCYEMEG